MAQTQPAPVAATPTPQVTQPADTPQDGEIPYDLNPHPKVDTKPEAETKPVEESISDKEENFKNIRKKLGDVTSTLKEKDKAIEELSLKVKKYETGEELPDVLKEKDAEIERLSRYEKLMSLKTSPAYKEAYIAPLEKVQGRLGEIAKDYAIPDEVINRALNLTNKKELNEFLTEHFDDVGALEVKELITEAQGIRSNAEEAEAEPMNALAELEKSYKNTLAQRRQQANNSIIETSKASWVDSLMAIKQEGKITELIHKDNDPEYNKTVVQPILQAASSEYGKLVRVLAENGLEKMPKDLGYALARLVHLAHASAVSIEARRLIEKELNDLKTSSDRTTRYTRPPLGGSMGGRGGSGDAQPAQPRSPQEAARAILNQVKRG